MDPITVLGAVAAATQLVEQGISITKFFYSLYTAINEAPAAIQKYVIQVEQIIDLSRLIIQNPSLQKDSVASILKTCLRDAIRFQEMLNKVLVAEKDGHLKKLQKAFSAVMKEKEFTALLDNLEREKSALTLCIQEIDSALLHSINIEVEGARKDIGQVAVVINDTARDVKTVVDKLPQLSENVLDIREMLLQLTVKPPPYSPLEGKPSQEKHYVVPNRRVRDFVGREDIIKRIEAGFSTDAGPRIVVLRGLGGQGKTQISLEYCRRAKTKIRAIFWIDASSENTTRQSIESIAQHIQEPEDKLQDGMVVSFVLGKLGEWTDVWLLVFDNYDDPKAFPNLQDFMPTGEHGCMLITTRHSDTDSFADPENVIELPGLPEEDALKLLYKQSGIKSTDTGWIEEGRNIVNRLGCHALAIAQAGSYIRLQKIPLNQFMAHYLSQRQRTAVLQQRLQLSQYRRKLSQAAAETDLNVFTTWDLSFQQLLRDKVMGKQNADLLTLFAFFDCKDISEDLFRIFSDYRKKENRMANSCGALTPFMNDNGDWDHEKFIQSLIELAGLSLIDNWARENDTCHISFHPLVKDWIRLRTSPKERRENSILAATALVSVIYANYRDYRILLSLMERQTLNSHVDSHRENMEDFDLDDPKGAIEPRYDDIERSEGVIAEFLEFYGRLEEAEEIRRRILLWHEKKYGKESKHTMVAAFNLARALPFQGKYQEAEDIYNAVLEFEENLYGAEDERTLQTMRSLAMVHEDKGHFKAAETIQRRELDICKRTLGLDNPHTLASFVTLANILIARGKYTEAEESLRYVVQKHEGPQDEVTVSTMTSLAICLAFQGKEKCLEGEQILRRVLKAHEKELESRLPVAIEELTLLGEVFRRQGRYEEAEKILREAIKSDEKVIGPGKRNTLVGVAMLGQTLLDQGKYKEAEAAIERAAKGLEKLLGTEHPETLECVLDLAALREGQQKYEEALALYQQAHLGLEKELVEDHPQVLRAAKGCSDMTERKTNSALEDQNQSAEQEAILTE